MRIHHEEALYRIDTNGMRLMILQGFVGLPPWDDDRFDAKKFLLFRAAAPPLSNSVCVDG